MTKLLIFGLLLQITWAGAQVKEFTYKAQSKDAFVKEIALPLDWTFKVPTSSNNAYDPYLNFWTQRQFLYPKNTDLIDKTFKKAEQFTKLSPTEFKRLDLYLTRARPIMDKALEMASGDSFQKTSSDLNFDLYSPTRWLVRNLSYEALFSFRKNDLKSSLKTISKAWGFSQDFDQQGGCILDRLVALAMKGITLQRIQWMIQHSSSPKVIHYLRNLIKDEPPINWKATLVCEIDFGINIMYQERHHKSLGERIDLTANMLAQGSYPLDAEELYNFEAITAKEALQYPRLMHHTYAFWLSKMDPINNQLSWTHQELGEALYSPYPLLETGTSMYFAMSMLHTVRLKITDKSNQQRATYLAASIRLFQMKYKGLPKTLESLLKAKLVSHENLLTRNGHRFDYSIEKRQIIYFDALTKRHRTVNF